MKLFKRIVLITLAVLVFGVGSFFFWLSGQYTVPILMYHHVEEIAEAQPNWISPKLFDWHMSYLKEKGYHVISLDKLVDDIKNQRRLKPKTVVITFDDGYENNFTNAYPILKKYQYPATIYVTSANVGQEGFLTVEQMQEMMKNGITIASHTKNHAYLPNLSQEEQQIEITESKRDLEQMLGVSIQHFSYPHGGFREDTKQMVKAAGYLSGATTNRGFDKLDKDVYELNRVRLSDKDIKEQYLFAKFSGYYNSLRKAKKPY